METFDQPFLIELLYLQIVRDTFSTGCLRLTDAERTNMKVLLCKWEECSEWHQALRIALLASLGVVTIDDIRRIPHVSAKRSIIDQARQWSIYFSRLFPIAVCLSPRFEDIQFDAFLSSRYRRLLPVKLNCSAFLILDCS